VSGEHSGTVFLILSGNRCGSTWLTFMLNALPDVAAEFEFQWREDVPSELHVAMKRPGFDLRAALTAISDAVPIRGSKLVCAGSRRFEDADYRGIRDAVPDGIKLVHLTRPYLESFLSKFRNAGHRVNADGVAAPRQSRAWLLDQPLSWYRKPQHMQDGDCVAIDAESVTADLSNRLANDEFFLSFRDRRSDYMLLEYRDIATRFREVAAHVGSRSSIEQVEDIVSRPPTSKLPAMDYAAFIANFDELAAIGADYEAQRQALFRNQLTQA
jgi:hypothetical protein